MKYSLSVSHNIALTPPPPTPLLLTVNNTRAHTPTHAHRDLRERGAASEMQDLGEGHSSRTNIAVCG